MAKIPEIKLEWIETAKLLILKRNPQYLTPKQMDALKGSIRRDGFVAPILVRTRGERYEIVSGNHRFMAAKEAGMELLPCVIREMSDKAATRLALNLNSIHGQPPVELLVPFLAELDDETLATVHIDAGELHDLYSFDENLKSRLDKLKIPDAMNTESPTHANKLCTCAKCGRKHFKPSDGVKPATPAE